MHVLLWCGLPVRFFVIALALHAVSFDAFVWWVNDELGFGENLTATLFAVSVVLAGWLACAPGIREVVWLRASFWLVAVLAFLVAGEEVSWGQHFFGWETPEWMAERNKQDLDLFCVHAGRRIATRPARARQPTIGAAWSISALRWLR